MVIRSKTCSHRSPIAKALPVSRPTGRPIDVPHCPSCAMPMRLSRIIPSAIHNHAESQVFVCEKCAAEVMRTVRWGSH
jgi:hypothetical protein